MRLRADAMEWLMVILTLCFIVAFASVAKGEEAQALEEKIVETAVEHGVDPVLALAIARVESNVNPRAVGSLGEVGVFQLRPEFHSVSEDEFANIETAIQYLAVLKERCAHYGDAYFICFNLGHVRRVNYPNKFPYYVKVMREKSKLLIAGAQ